MKGFLVSLISVALIAILFMFSSSLHNNALSMERALIKPQPVTYAAFIFDEVGDDVNKIVGPDMEFFESNDSMGIMVTDAVPGFNFSDELADYEAFLENVTADEIHAIIDANFSNLSSLDVEVEINERYEYTSNQQEMLFTSPGGTGALSYEINVTVYKTRANITFFSFDPGGDLDVSMIYADLNGTVIENGKVHSNLPNTFTVLYDDGSSLDITVGLKSGEDGSLYIKPTDTEAYFTLYALLPKPDADKRIGYGYDAIMNYSQGDVLMTRNIGK